MAGSGPLCPIDNRHGRMVYIDGGIHCPHNAHGGNGYTFRREADLEAYVSTEEDEVTRYEQAAKDVVQGKASLDVVVAQIAKQTKQSTAVVRQQVKIAVDVLTETATAKEAEKAQMDEKKTAAAKAEGRKTTKRPAGEKAEALEHVDGQVVRDTLKEFGLTGKDLAHAGGFSPSRVSELTKVGDIPASWNGRYRRATTRQWNELLPKLQAMAVKPGADAAAE